MKLSFKHCLFFASLSPLLVQCGNVFLSPEDKEVAPAPTSSVGEPYAGPMRGQVIPTREANRYLVQLQWHPKNTGSALTLSRAESGRTPLEIKTMSSDSNSWLDAQIEAGKTYEYVLHGDGVEESATVSIPLDAEYRGTNIITEPIKVARLFLREGAELSSKIETSPSR